ncbi:MAG: PEP-CTERM sorting domain-containing protein [Verrucomicrobia bacterium]|nr:PEP-CTERM sorting domain-containing protein [Verrucomicrobiota bacterium]
MKKVIIALAALFVMANAYGQGTVQLNNRIPGQVDAKVLMPGGGVGVSDAAFKAQLYAAGGADQPLSALKAVPTTTAFRTGNAAGYIVPVDVTVPGIAAGAKATVVLRVYNGAAFEGSTIFGTSNPINIDLGGAGTPPGPGSVLAGLQGFTLVPEPSTIALGILGAAALILRRRK